jgi:hypothetical protein
MIKYLWIIVSLLLLFAHPLWAKKEGEATTTFLLLPPSARTVGVGGAGVAAPLGASSIFYNPASLATSEGVHATFMYSSYIVDTSFGNAALSYPTPFATIGAGFIYLGHGKIQGYDEAANPLGTYTAQDMCAVLSLAKNSKKGSALGHP